MNKWKKMYSRKEESYRLTNDDVTIDIYYDVVDRSWRAEISSMAAVEIVGYDTLEDIKEASLKVKTTK